MAGSSKRPTEESARRSLRGERCGAIPASNGSIAFFTSRLAPSVVLVYHRPREGKKVHHLQRNTGDNKSASATDDAGVHGAPRSHTTSEYRNSKEGQNDVKEQIVDWEMDSGLDEEPESDPTDIEAIYNRPLSPKEQICEQCRIPVPCWC